jgi:hypothetical protein
VQQGGHEVHARRRLLGPEKAGPFHACAKSYFLAMKRPRFLCGN